MPFHHQPTDRKQDMADDVREWVQKTNCDPKATLPTLVRLSRKDLTDLMLAVHRAEEQEIDLFANQKEDMI